MHRSKWLATKTGFNTRLPSKIFEHSSFFKAIRWFVIQKWPLKHMKFIQSKKKLFPEAILFAPPSSVQYGVSVVANHLEDELASEAVENYALELAIYFNKKQRCDGHFDEQQCLDDAREELDFETDPFVRRLVDRVSLTKGITLHSCGSDKKILELCSKFSKFFHCSFSWDLVRPSQLLQSSNKPFWIVQFVIHFEKS